MQTNLGIYIFAFLSFTDILSLKKQSIYYHNISCKTTGREGDSYRNVGFTIVELNFLEKIMGKERKKKQGRM